MSRSPHQSNTSFATDVGSVLGPDGPLAQHVAGFNHRPQQQAMAEAIAATMAEGGTLIAEAGTGTGKTFAYLVPALTSGLKVVVSTGTRNLQDQLFHRDLPTVREALQRPVSVSLLKGRANYLCLYRLDQALPAGRRRSAEATDLLARVRQWAGRTQRGDIAELSDIAEDAGIWPAVTSTVDNCLGHECPRFDDCHLMEARRRAQEADVVVINHHLLCADLSLRDEGFGELLPDTDCFVIDEAHQLPEVASNFFGRSVSGRQIMELARDALTEYHRDMGDMPQFPEAAAILEKAVRDLRLSFGVEQRRGSWRDIRHKPEIQESLGHARTQLAVFSDLLEGVSERGKGLQNCHRRSQDLVARLQALDEEDSGTIRWFETHRQSFNLNLTPLDIADTFLAHMDRHPAAWVFTSATLAVGEDFSHFARQLGIESAAGRCWESPFDFRRQALFYLPQGMPEPRDPGFGRAFLDTALAVLEASRGRAFLLFTSYRALRAAADGIAEHIDYPLLVQGSAPRDELLARFRELGNAVLLGTASFWEGVDVRGSALSCVIIDKLPFAAPGDPVFQARIEALRAKGGNPFMDYQVPQAVIALKQGVGRLIRDVSDRGVLVLCDSRIASKPYGRVFLSSLPDMTRTRSIENVRRFFDVEREAVLPAVEQAG